MSGFVYSIVKLAVKSGLYSYHKRIKVFGLENIPKYKPILFLPNHQSALIDVLLIGTDCKRKPFFLTRADVFSKPFLKSIFSYFRMLPIYRMRDGRKTLSNNNLIFDECAYLLNRGEALVVFPEANHNLKRRVRPLSKGFTRIILRAFEMNPTLDIQLVPIGLNYKNAANFPDEVAVYYGKPISARSLYDKANLNESSLAIKNDVASRLKGLTTHIPEELDYDASIRTLHNVNANFLNPEEINNKLKLFTAEKLSDSKPQSIKSGKISFSYYVLVLFNFPVVLFWCLVIKPKIQEPEFMGTFRFATGFILFPVYLTLLLLLLAFFLSFNIALLSVFLLTMLNMVLVKFALD
ncbi:lysophospholipid acyltransferase family protein [Maribacter sp. ACAM166]|uniref:lysophospholipid acyltransferase family protein n=1 Tax=Maribacter sp. ACAM166 TaxID=2508996 RepID=UPI0010FEF97A|nr:lysophospholipid acyltransferase family protein [Maribacter sp. ACAM166]TLP80418.1 glycerol acyltransferase [Maribacter sp. ACAM166]